MKKEDRSIEVVLISPFKLRHRLFAYELQKNHIRVNSVLIEKPKIPISKLIKNFFSISKVLDFCLSTIEFINIGVTPLVDAEKVYLNSISDIKITETINMVSPDAVIVYGGSVIPNKILENIVAPSINIHGAVLPGYRGLDSHWWLMLDSKKYLQGYSVHFLESGIDTGNIIVSKQYDGFRNQFARNTNWRLWIAKYSAVDIAILLKNNLSTAPSMKHDLTKSTYRSKISLRNFILSRK